MNHAYPTHPRYTEPTEAARHGAGAERADDDQRRARLAFEERIALLLEREELIAKIAAWGGSGACQLKYATP